MGEYSYILEQQGKTTAEKLAAFTTAIGWRDELATYRIAQDEFEMRAAAAAEQGISLLDVPPYTAEELAALDAESAAYYEAFAANYVATAAFTGSGSGTQIDPYIITTPQQLQSIGDDLSAYYAISNDIDLSDVQWAQIGSPESPFTGSLDGNGYTISGLDYTSSINGWVCFIVGDNSTTSPKSSISNIKFSGISITNSYNVGWYDGESDASILYSVAICDQIYFDGVVLSGVKHASPIAYAKYVSNCLSIDCISISGAYSSNLCFVDADDVTNCYVYGGHANNLDTYSTTMPIAPVITRVSSGDSASACVAIDCDLQTQSGNINPGRVIGDLRSGGSVDHMYASNIILNGVVMGSGTTTNKNGADVSPSTYHTQAFWQNTLGWDFDTVWYWDSTEQLPKLRAFLLKPTFPLNVEIGSPKYTTVSQINYSASAFASVQVTPTTSGTTPVSNSYYTFQSQDGQHWMTAYVGKWTDNGGSWTADIKWSSSNTNSLSAQSICWCVWCKEYYQSIIDKISG